MKIGIHEAIKYHRDKLEDYERYQKCKHEFIIEEGDNLSTTGPTGLYRNCKKCGYSEGDVGYIGATGRIFYEEEKTKDREVIDRALKVGLNRNDIERIRNISIRDYYEILR